MGEALHCGCPPHDPGGLAFRTHPIRWRWARTNIIVVAGVHSVGWRRFQTRGIVVALLFAFSLTPDEGLGFQLDDCFRCRYFNRHDGSDFVKNFLADGAARCSPRSVGYTNGINSCHGSNSGRDVLHLLTPRRIFFAVNTDPENSVEAIVVVSSKSNSPDSTAATMSLMDMVVGVP